ncbi:MAG: alcohol dehydrogenase catalytic domain-containing protein [Fimbriimonadaceae bacterium]|nr:alcohol dehydrogenase catalytic domain-containing protein [Fimbriimonadaceae bacterium]
MRAVCVTPKLRYLDDYPAPQAAAGEALLQVRLAAICGTDLELLQGYHGFCGVLGHEFVADVVGGPEVWRGRRVVAEINCAPSGEARHHPQRTVVGILGRHGAFAEQLTVPWRNLHAVPEAVPDEHAVCCEPLAAALRIKEQVGLTPSAAVGVLGAGRLGLLVGLVLALDGTAVTVLCRQPAAAARASACGLAVADATTAGAGRYPVLVDCTGSPDGLARAIELTRPEGLLILKSTFVGTAAVATSAIVVKELTVVGSRCGPFAPALRLLASGRLPLDKLIEATYPLAEAAAALAHAARPGAGKILLRP